MVTSTTTMAAAGATLPARLDAIRDASGFPQAIIDAFGEYVRSAPDEDLFRTNPYRYAQVQGIADQQAIDLFLYATHAGVLEFNWGVLCPNCYAFVTSPGGLRAIKTNSHCEICDIDFDVTIDDNIEVAFTVAPTVRRIRFHDLNTIDLQRDWLSIFYSPSRFVDSLIREQLGVLMITSCLLQNEGRTSLELHLEPDARYLVLTPRHHAVATVYGTQGETTSEVHFDIFDGRFVPDYVPLAPESTTLHFHNRTGSAITIGVLLDPKTFQPEISPENAERIMRFFSTPPKFLTGKQIAMSQVFREIFRAESIPSEMGVAFKSVTFLFSDLKGSTALYNRVGDVRAYQIVREHFALLRDVVAQFGGAIVKTMGDAVMASFAEPLAALEAAIVMRREVPRLESDQEEGLILRIGVHSGPCIAVESNDRLDYFGQTVNIAARVENVAGAGEIVITEPVYDAPGAADVIAAMEMRAEEASAVLRGIDYPVTFYRLT